MYKKLILLWSLGLFLSWNFYASDILSAAPNDAKGFQKIDASQIFADRWIAKPGRSKSQLEMEADRKFSSLSEFPPVDGICQSGKVKLSEIVSQSEDNYLIRRFSSCGDFEIFKFTSSFEVKDHFGINRSESVLARGIEINEWAFPIVKVKNHLFGKFFCRKESADKTQSTSHRDLDQWCLYDFNLVNRNAEILSSGIYMFTAIRLNDDADLLIYSRGIDDLTHGRGTESFIDEVYRLYDSQFPDGTVLGQLQGYQGGVQAAYVDGNKLFVKTLDAAASFRRSAPYISDQPQLWEILLPQRK